MKFISQNRLNPLIPVIRYNSGCTCAKCGCSCPSTCDQCDMCAKCCQCGEK